MCLVEVVGNKKLVASCAALVFNNINILTSTSRVRKSREGVLELLLYNHPLDCPICDQAGECDLQDITMKFGGDRGRFYELEKRAVSDKYCGPFVKTSMNRCIHCTRCVRFGTEIVGSNFLGTTGRGINMEIGTYVNSFEDNELSGNIVDLCPVGALTSKPYSFTNRPWELRSVESLDLMDSFASSIRADCYGSSIVRLLPKTDDSLNEEWLTNKSRYCYDGLNYQRLSFPMIRLNSSELHKVTYDTALMCIFEKILQNLDIVGSAKNVIKLSFVAGPFLDLETSSLLKFLVYFLNGIPGVKAKIFSDEKLLNLEKDSSPLFLESKISSVYDFKGVGVFVGFNPRLESPILNAKFRKLAISGQISFFSIGLGLNYTTFAIKNLGNTYKEVLRLAEFRSPNIVEFISPPVFFIGKAAVNRKDFNSIKTCIYNYVSRLLKFDADPASFIYTIPSSLGYISSQKFGLFSNEVVNEKLNSERIFYTDYNAKSLNIIYFLSANFLNEIYIYKKKFNNNCIFVYQGSNGENSVGLSDIVLPVKNFFEDSKKFVDLNNNVRSTNEVISSFKKNLLSDYDIFKQIIMGLVYERRSFLNLIFGKCDTGDYLIDSCLGFKDKEEVKNLYSLFENIVSVKFDKVTLNNIWLNPENQEFIDFYPLFEKTRKDVVQCSLKNAIKYCYLYYNLTELDLQNRDIKFSLLAENWHNKVLNAKSFGKFDLLSSNHFKYLRPIQFYSIITKKVDLNVINLGVDNYYKTNVFARSSKILSEASLKLLKQNNSF